VQAELAHIPGRPALPVGALPSIWLIPSARFTDAQIQKEQASHMKTTQNILTLPRHCFLLIGGVAFAQTPDHIADREVHRRQAVIPEGEAGLAGGFFICAAKIRS
jgi:YVTN family beta-propeller protein